MPLPSSWADHLFAKLTVRYGDAFARQYADLDPELVKADWAEVLDGFSRERLSHALRHLPTDRPPNALQFRELCRMAPIPEQLALPGAPADPVRVASALGQLRLRTAGDGSDPKAWAHRLRQREAAGETLGYARRMAWREALRETQAHEPDEAEQDRVNQEMAANQRRIAERMAISEPIHASEVAP